jgi:hypothetical protein
MTWLELARVAHWVMDGPRSILHLNDETGTKFGWLEPVASWRRFLPGREMEVWTVFRIHYPTASTYLPAELLRRAHWDIASNKQTSCEADTETLQLVTEYWALDDALQKLYEAFESTLPFNRDECAAAPFPQASTDETAAGVFELKFPTGQCSFDLHWIAFQGNTSLTELWKSTLNMMRQSTQQTIVGDTLIECYALDPYDPVYVKGDSVSNIAALL